MTKLDFIQSFALYPCDWMEPGYQDESKWCASLRVPPQDARETMNRWNLMRTLDFHGLLVDANQGLHKTHGREYQIIKVADRLVLTDKMGKQSPLPMMKFHDGEPSQTEIDHAVEVLTTFKHEAEKVIAQLTNLSKEWLVVPTKVFEVTPELQRRNS